MEKSKNNLIIVIVAIFASYCVAFNLFKVASTTTLIMEAFNVNSQQVGSLVSVAGLVGLIFAIPSGALVTKFGTRKIGIFAIGCSFLGSVIGSFAPNFEILLASRFLEGVTIGAIPTIIPPIIVDNIDKKKQSIFIGLFTCFSGIGQIVIFSLTNTMVNIQDAHSFTNVWHFTSVFIGIALVLWIVFVKSPESIKEKDNKNVDMRKGFLNSLMWIMCLITFLSIAGFNGGTNYTMNYCEQICGDPLLANNLATIRSITMIASSILVGLIIAPFNTKKRGMFLFVFSILILVSFSIMWQFTDKVQAIISMLIIGFSITAHPTVLVSLTPAISKDPKYVAITNSFLAIGQNLGAISVGTISGRILEVYGFGALSIVYIGFAIVIVVGTFLIYASTRKTKI